jgi:hypothetical protein
MAELVNIRGANYIPAEAWNAYQQWKFYDEARTVRDLGYAQQLGLNSLRVWVSYEWWREQAEAFKAGETPGNAHIGNLEHFLTECDNHGIKPVMVLFEAPPQGDPAQVDKDSYQFGLHSPSRSEILQPQDWSGWEFSPMHFTNRFANAFGDDSRVLAWEIMNEPANVEPRKTFVFDMLDEFDANTTTATLTMGTKETNFAQIYDQYDQLDVWQFHDNLPADPEAAREYYEDNRIRTDKPLWLSEWQRTLEEPPDRGLPNYASLAPTVRDEMGKTLEGNFVWDLMFSPAYLRNPREGVGRTNGVFHPDGAVFNAVDAEAVAGTSLTVNERMQYPSKWASSWAFPEPSYPGSGDGGDSGGGELGVSPALVLGGAGLVWIATRGDE